MFSMTRKFLFVGLVLITAVFTTTLLISTLHSAQAAVSDTTVLYDGSVGGTPDTQNFGYLALDTTPFDFTIDATQTFSSDLQATILNTTPDMDEHAGYTISTTSPITFDRSTGFQLDMTVRIASETHQSDNTRAGFSITFLANDARGIEVAFWEDRIWVQEGGSPPELFTSAEGIDFDTTADFVDYSLTIITDTYSLSADEVPILTGSLRDYTAWEPPFGLPIDVYEQPNLLSLSDNTTSAQGEAWLSYVAVTTDLFPPPPIPLVDLSPSFQVVSETIGTAVFTVQLESYSAQTITVAIETVDGTAVTGVDYIAISQTIVFPPATISQTIAVPILDNDIGNSSPRQFQVQLTNPTHAQLGNPLATVSILDDDIDQFVYLPMIIREE